MSIARRHAILAALATGTLPRLAEGQGASSGGYPTRAVSVMVPFAPGGSTDFVARLLAQQLGARLGQQFVVDNRAGASGTVGMTFLARAKADGYTLGVVPNGTFAMAPFMFERLPYDNDRAFAPIGMLASNAMFICVAPDAPYRTLTDLLDAARQKPGTISYASAGSGVANHLGVELMLDMAEAQMLHVPYRSGAQGVQAIMSRDVALSFVDSVTAVPYLRSGELRALAFTGAARSRQAPEVPTVAEGASLPGYRASTDFGFFAPAGTPEPVLRQLADAARTIMLSAEVRDKLEPLAIDPVGGTPEEFGPYAEQERARWGALIRKRNIKPE
ncbi:Bug family tripartite tricarboxylate transporter substrate binding protein [Teichococcus vastitatis]|uniref:Tripartite tricarboxylate transporter substrate binding protein n=1 Tax=Teichococcus vastitatis TaxID=2307076 RepID=A0ABS9W0U7_9PROT|nr:tripartite tricarboxylate transporter substrate binding protein [Pseudoroseomonas vastitatis]MCI0752922.1 tripartite tricarboxylate transporter substrate binding protein [Pseudoroseomonas vastitatis]